MDLRVCLVATELFSWGRFGGFGAATRMIGSGLAERGAEVTVVVPRGLGQRQVERLDGMTVLSHRLHEYPLTGGLYRRVAADVYHSQEPSPGTVVALAAVPRAAHVATLQNPRTREDWRRVEGYYPLRRRVYNAVSGGVLRWAVRRLRGVYVQAWSMAEKAQLIYRFGRPPGFLPNPVEVPAAARKPGQPTMLFLGRFDPEKAPEAFFRLAVGHPGVRFVAAGRSHDAGRDRALRSRYGRIRNLELPGMVTGAEKSRILDESWVLVNTSVSEGLPVSFLEAAAHGCAVLSPHDPDGFASRFGCLYREGGCGEGLRWLLDGDRWRRLGGAGRDYVSRVHEKGAVIDKHLRLYAGLLGG